MNYLYLHGFASRPRSIKAIYLQNRFAHGLTDALPEIWVEMQQFCGLK